MIEPQLVKQFELALQAGQPPTEAAEQVPGPAINRGAPELAGGREVVGRHAALGRERAIGAQGEQGAVGPDIGAVVGHIKRQVAQQLHAGLAGLAAQLLPLALQLPLKQLLLQQPIGMIGGNSRQGAALTLGQGRRPLPPGLAALEPADHHEKGVVWQPAPLAAPPAGKSPLLLCGLSTPAAGQGLP